MSPAKYVCLLACVCALGYCRTHNTASFRFASYYNDNMVLQATPYSANIWGYSGKVGDRVEVKVESETLVTTTVKTIDGQGIWFVQLPVMETSASPRSISAVSSEGNIQIKNVLFGDVWLCSGQSNMQFTLDMVNNATAELQDSKNYPNIRLFTVTENQSPTPFLDLQSIEEPWSIPSPDTVGHKAWTYFSAVCWLYGKYLYDTLKKPIGLIDSTWGGTMIETWSTEDSLSLCRNKSAATPSQPGGFPVDDSVLWNAMIHPLINMTMYGAIWYQGEANQNDPALYNCTFPAMIDDWRVKFNLGSQGATSKNFPFGFVQLAPYRKNSTIQVGFPGIRWSQTAGFGYVPNKRMQNVFMAVAMDLPDFDSPYTGIHPRDKQDVSSRLVKAGLSVAYDVANIKFQGPMPDLYSHNTDQKYITADYSSYNESIEVRSTNGFEICCDTPDREMCRDPNHQWIPTPIMSSTSHSITVNWTQSCTQLQAIRYAWRESPCPFKKCAVYAQESQLPAPPLFQFL